MNLSTFKGHFPFIDADAADNWFKERAAAIVQARESGMTWPHIAASVGLSIRRVQKIYAKQKEAA